LYVASDSQVRQLSSAKHRVNNSKCLRSLCNRTPILGTELAEIVHQLQSSSIAR
jgi:hypothetical protein